MCILWGDVMIDTATVAVAPGSRQDNVDIEATRIKIDQFLELLREAVKDHNHPEG